MNRVKYTEWIDDYVEGGLSDQDRKKFEAELTVNPDLALEYQLEKDLEEILKDEDLLDLRAKCISAQNEINLSNRKFVKIVQITRKYWYAAASLVLIAMVVGGIMFFSPGGGYTAEKLFKMYYKSGETMGNYRSGNGNMVEALMYFSKNDFKTADRLFDDILASDPDNIAVMYYSGISNIEISDFSKAIKRFNDIIANGDNLYIENAEWYLGLTELAAGNLNEARRTFLAIISKPNSYHYKDAVSILEKMDVKEQNKKLLNNLFFLILPF